MNANSLLRIIVAASGAFTPVVAVSSTAQAQLTVTPIILEFAAESATETRSISVTNTGRTPIEVRFYAGDFDQNEVGEHRFAAAGALPNSCGAMRRASRPTCSIAGSA